MRVPSSPKRSASARRSPSPSPRRSPSPAARSYLRPLLLANRAGTTLIRPPFQQGTSTSPPRHYKMTKSRHTPTPKPTSRPETANAANSANLSATIPEITVTSPTPTSTVWPQVSMAIDEADHHPTLPVRTSSRDAMASSPSLAPDFSDIPRLANQGQENTDPRFLAPYDQAPPITISAGAVLSNTTWDHNPSPNSDGSEQAESHCVPHPDVPLAPHALRRVGNAWDFMPGFPFPARALDNPSRQRVVRRYNGGIGRRGTPF